MLNGGWRADDFCYCTNYRRKRGYYANWGGGGGDITRTERGRWLLYELVGILLHELAGETVTRTGGGDCCTNRREDYCRNWCMRELLYELVRTNKWTGGGRGLLRELEFERVVLLEINKPLQLRCLNRFNYSKYQLQYQMTNVISVQIYTRVIRFI